MQPYFDPTRKMTFKKDWETTSKKIKMEDNLNIFLKNKNDNLKKNGR
jgi:hypothetical protein